MPRLSYTEIKPLKVFVRNSDVHGAGIFTIICVSVFLSFTLAWACHRNRREKGCCISLKHLAEELERLVVLHDASTIAAVIVEPMAGSTGVLAPPKAWEDRPHLGST